MRRSSSATGNLQKWTPLTLPCNLKNPPPIEPYFQSRIKKPTYYTSSSLPPWHRPLLLQHPRYIYLILPAAMAMVKPRTAPSPSSARSPPGSHGWCRQRGARVGNRRSRASVLGRSTCQGQSVRYVHPWTRSRIARSDLGIEELDRRRWRIRQSRRRNEKKKQKIK